MATSHKHARSDSHEHAHRHAAARRKRRLTHLALPAAGLLTLVAASTAVVLGNAAVPVVSASDDRGDLITAALQSDQQVSRSADRAPLANEAAAEKMVKGRMFVIESDAADVYADADDTSPVLAVLAPGDRVDVTGKKLMGWTEIVHKARPRWVKSDNLTKKEPLGMKPCPKASENGLQPDTVRVVRAVCARFPAVRSYGGTRGGGGDHGIGRAVDIMVDPDTGRQIAAFLQENRAELGIEYLIFRQRIWRPATSSNWRGMSDRGSPTANHMDHVHANTYGNSGTG